MLFFIADSDRILQGFGIPKKKFIARNSLRRDQFPLNLMVCYLFQTTQTIRAYVEPFFKFCHTRRKKCSHFYNSFTQQKQFSILKNWFAVFFYQVKNYADQNTIVKVFTLMYEKTRFHSSEIRGLCLIDHILYIRNFEKPKLLFPFRTAQFFP